MVVLVANPAAGDGRGARVLARARVAFEQVLGPVRLLVTQRPDDEPRLVAEALDGGCSALAVLGGDGTWSKAARALIALGSDCPLVLLAAGTGNDLAKSVGVPALDYASMARLTAAGGTRRIDAGRVGERVFVNVVGFGINAAVLAAMRRTRLIPRSAQYAEAAVRQLVGYRGFSARLDLPGVRRSDDATYLGIFVANGARVGGAFHIAPDAALDDGQLDVITLGEAALVRRVRLFAAAIRGTHLGAPEITSRRVATLRLEFPAPPYFDADGDLCLAESRMIEIECLPGAVRLVA